jgi:hypothetical protein
MDPRLLTVPFGALSLAERASALDAARAAGAAAVTGPVEPGDLEAPRPLEYYLHVIAPLEVREQVNARTAAGWKLRCLDHRALEDPRVQAFLCAWHEHALAILREIADAPREPRPYLLRLLE